MSRAKEKWGLELVTSVELPVEGVHSAGLRQWREQIGALKPEIMMPKGGNKETEIPVQTRAKDRRPTTGMEGQRRVTVHTRRLLLRSREGKSKHRAPVLSNEDTG